MSTYSYVIILPHDPSKAKRFMEEVNQQMRPEYEQAFRQVENTGGSDPEWEMCDYEAAIDMSPSEVAEVLVLVREKTQEDLGDYLSKDGDVKLFTKNGEGLVEIPIPPF